MTKQQAEKLAMWDNKAYIARKTKNGDWGVWCTNSDHWVEFDIGLSCNRIDYKTLRQNVMVKYPKTLAYLAK